MAFRVECEVIGCDPVARGSPDPISAACVQLILVYTGLAELTKADADLADGDWIIACSVQPMTPMASEIYLRGGSL